MKWSICILINSSQIHDFRKTDEDWNFDDSAKSSTSPIWSNESIKYNWTHALCLLTTKTHTLSPQWGTSLPLSRFGVAMVIFLLCGSHTLVALALSKPLPMLKPNFTHLHFFTKIWSFNGKLATHTWFLLHFSLCLRRACTINFPLLL